MAQNRALEFEEEEKMLLDHTIIVGVSEVQFLLQSALNCLNLKWQVVEHVG